MTQNFDDLVHTALAAHFSGWDFSYLEGRWQEDDPTWSYRSMVMDHITRAGSLLDMGTGGGEFLASLPHRPQDTCATEGYTPNIPIAQKRLAPLGVDVRPIAADEIIPFEDQRFDLVINRHESFLPAEVWRVLKPGGIFLTQQVGGDDNHQLNAFIAPDQPRTYTDFNLAAVRTDLERQGFAVLESAEERPQTRFFDIGAVVYYLKVISWQIEGFSVEKYEARLRDLHAQIEKQGYFQTNTHRFYITSRKPAV